MDEERESDATHYQAELQKLKNELLMTKASEAAMRVVSDRLRGERDAFKAAFDDAPFMLIWCDRNGRAIRLNKATSAVLAGLEPPPDFSVYNDPQLILLGVPEVFDRALAGETMHMPRYVYNASVTHLGAPDVDIHMETTLYPIFGSKGDVESVMVRHDDVTELVMAEREIERLRGLLAAGH